MNPYLLDYFNVPYTYFSDGGDSKVISMLHRFGNKKMSDEEKECLEDFQSDLYQKILTVFDIDVEGSIKDLIDECTNFQDCLFWLIRCLRRECSSRFGKGTVQASVELEENDDLCEDAAIQKKDTQDEILCEESDLQFLNYQIWLLLEGARFDGSFLMKHILDEVPIKEIDGNLLDNKSLIGTKVTEKSLQAHLAKAYKRNFLNYLLADDETFKTLSRFDTCMELKEGHKYIKNCYSEAFAEMRIAALACGARDVFYTKFSSEPKKGDRSYSLRVLKCFYDNLHKCIEIQSRNPKTRKTAPAFWKNYSDISISAQYYFVEMLYAFELFDSMLDRYFNTSPVSQSSELLTEYSKDCSELVRIPNVVVRKWLAEELWNDYQNLYRFGDSLQREAIKNTKESFIYSSKYEQDDLTQAEKDLKKTIRTINRDAALYYPLLMIFVIELMNQFSANASDPCECIGKELMKADQKHFVWKREKCFGKYDINRSVKEFFVFYETIQYDFYRTPRQYQLKFKRKMPALLDSLSDMLYGFLGIEDIQNIRDDINIQFLQ